MQQVGMVALLKRRSNSEKRIETTLGDHDEAAGLLGLTPKVFKLIDMTTLLADKPLCCA